jgi:hypothetical protein
MEWFRNFEGVSVLSCACPVALVTLHHTVTQDSQENIRRAAVPHSTLTSRSQLRFTLTLKHIEDIMAVFRA